MEFKEKVEVKGSFIMGEICSENNVAGLNIKLILGSKPFVEDLGTENVRNLIGELKTVYNKMLILEKGDNYTQK